MIAFCPDRLFKLGGVHRLTGLTGISLGDILKISPLEPIL